MNIQGITNKILTNKQVLSCLEKVSEHGTSVAVGTSLLMSLTVRPAMIFLTPDTEKENKQYAASNSICSGLVKFGIVEAIAIPVENAIKKIDKNPKKFLSPKTINNLIGNSKDIASSRSYRFLTQIIKLGVNFVTAVPKSIITIALIPFIMDKIFNNKKRIKNELNENSKPLNKTSQPSFEGKINDKIAQGIGKIIDNKTLQNFSIKYQNNDRNIAKHITAGTDVLLTLAANYKTDKSKDIKQNRKKALIYNNTISTGFTIGVGYLVDGLIKRKSENFIENFKNINKENPKLAKYIEGINILRPALIFAGIYYGILPIFSTYLSEKIDKYVNKKVNK